MDDQRKDHIDLKRPPKRNRSTQLQAHNVPIYVMENTNDTNKGRDLFLANELWRTERMPQRNQRHNRATLH